MPVALIRGVHINYKVVGSSGPWIALTPGSRRAYGELLDLSQAIASHGYRVLLHDRRNCGASDVAFDGSGSEHEVWADDLRALGGMLGANSITVGGSSAGARLAILFAIRHPDAIAGLLLWRVTGGQEAVDRLAEAYYGHYIALATRGGMAAICASEHFRDCIAANPGNRDRLMATRVDDFVAVMTTWREKFLESASLPIVGATEAQLNAIRVPACIVAGNDVIHTPEAARKAACFIPGAELHDDVVERRVEGNLRADWDRREWQNAEPRLATLFVDFLNRRRVPA